jgi:hypothetical protein
LDGINGVWHQLFKLRAKPAQREKAINCNKLGDAFKSGNDHQSHPKFAIRSFLVRRTRNEQMPK